MATPSRSDRMIKHLMRLRKKDKDKTIQEVEHKNPEIDPEEYIKELKRKDERRELKFQ